MNSGSTVVHQVANSPPTAKAAGREDSTERVEMSERSARHRLRDHTCRMRYPVTVVRHTTELPLVEGALAVP